MTKYIRPLLCASALMVTMSDPSWALSAKDLRPDAPHCKMPEAAVPKLPPKLPNESENWDTDQQIFADFTGDGWCDYALAVPYPINSKMNSFDLDEIMRLGDRNRWLPVLHGRKSYRVPEIRFDNVNVPFFRVDLSNIHLVYPKVRGAPYVIGLMAGESPWTVDRSPPHCTRYDLVYQWNAVLGAFKRVDSAIADVVIKYYYAEIAKPCASVGQCQSYPDCRYGWPHSK